MAAKIRSLQQWCKRQCEGYRDVEVTNMTSSWKSGLAFCAIIHRYRPDLIDYDSLSKENVYDNNKLAFDVAHESLDVPALLDAEDMVTMTIPDKLCIVTYVSQYYNYFRDKNPDGGPGVKACRAPTKRSSSTTTHTSAPEPKKLTPQKSSSSTDWALTTQNNAGTMGEASKRGTFGDTCHLCKKKVYLMERHIEGSRLYHRRCIRDQQKSQRSPPASATSLQSQTSPATPSSTIQPKSVPVTASSVFQYPQPSANTISHTSLHPPTNSSRSVGSQGTPHSTVRVNGNSSKHFSSSNVSDDKKEPSIINQSNKKSANQTSLVKMLYGGPAPYGATSSTTQPSYTDPANSKPNSSNLWSKPSSSLASSSSASSSSSPHGKPSSNGSIPSSINTTEKRNSISQKAALFDTGPKPKFGAAFAPKGKLASSDVTSQKQTKGLSSNAQSLFSGDHGPSDARRPQPMEVDTPFPTNHTPSAASLTQPTVYTYHSGAKTGEPEPGSDVKTGLLASLANIRQNPNTEVKTTPSSLLPNHTSSIPPTGATSSILKSRYTAEGLTDTSAHKSILKPTSPRGSFDASSPSDHRPILKAKTSDDGENASSSPPKSILKYAELSPNDSGTMASVVSSHRSKSILKANEPVELEIDLGEHGMSSGSTQPRSILKHVEDPPMTKEDRATSRSILKQETTEDGSTPESKSILKSPEHNISLSSNSNRPSRAWQPKTSAVAMETETNKVRVGAIAKSNQTTTSRPESAILVPAPRAQVKVMADLTGNKDRGTEKSKYNSPVSAILGGKNNRTPSPRSILRRKEQTNNKQKASESSVGEKVWGKPVPKSDLSGQGPTVSSSVSKKPAHPQSVATNNFSAFNLQDSLLLHADTKEDDPKSNKAGSGLSIDRGKSAQTKPTWQIEMEARKGIQSKPTRAAPPRPVGPPPSVGPTPSSESHTSDKNHSPNVTSKEPQPSKPEWQLEAERRTKMRQGKYQDPEFKYKYAKDSTASGDVHVKKPLPDRKSADLSSSNTKNLTVTIPEKQSRHSIGSPLDSSQTRKNDDRFNKPLSKGISDGHLPVNPPRPPPPRHKVASPNAESLKSPPHNYETIWEPSPRPDGAISPSSPSQKLSRTPAFRITDSPESSPEVSRATANDSSQVYIEMNGEDMSKKKILPEVNFTFHTGDFEMILMPESTGLRPGSQAQRGSQDTDRGSWIQQRPLPMPPTTVEVAGPVRRQVNADTRVSTLKIVQQLEDIDKQLRALEEEGRCMEDKIRAVSDEQMDDEESMTAWFETISKKNDLVRKESELMYKQRQQELEDVHTDLEHELRILMVMPEHEKTASDRVRETSLIAELLETVDLRNNIVDSMEEDRIRYIAEDEEIAEMMAKTVSGGESDKKKNKKKKADKRKKQPKEGKGEKDSPDKKGQTEKERKFFRKSIGSGGL